MNYWTELGWILFPMNGVEVGFALGMCWLANQLDKRKG